MTERERIDLSLLSFFSLFLPFNPLDYCLLIPLKDLMTHRLPLYVPLTIQQFSSDGWGQAVWQKSEDKSVLVDVPFTMPGDQVEAELFKSKKGAYQGRLKQIIQPSPERVTPRCLHFGSCGGCRWQHVPPTQQLQLKEEGIWQLFAPFIDQRTTCYPIIPCTPPWYYRNKMELTFSSDKHQQRYLGLIMWGTRGHVFQMKECHLVQPWVAQTAQIVADWWANSGLEAYNPHRDTGTLRTLTLREGMRTGDRMVILTVSGHPDYAIHRNQLNTFLAVLQASIHSTQPDQHLSIFLRIQQVAKGRPTQFYEMLLAGPDHIREKMDLVTAGGQIEPLEFRISPSAFFQPNTVQAEKIYARALALSQLSSDSLVYDLYCGTGTLGTYLAKQVREVVGIELSPESVIDAKENIRLNHLNNLSIYTGDVGKILAQWKAEQKPPPDAVMVDPPRVGLDAQTIRHLLDLNPPCLTYISCNPKTQAANLEAFIKEGYHLQAIQPVDQFPQTIHVENIVVLKR